MSRSPVFPMFGSGRALMQPVFVEDLAAGIVTAITKGGLEFKEYNLCGPEPISYREIVETILQILHRRVVLVSVNTHAAAVIARYAQRIPGFPVTEEQVLRLLEDKAFDISAAVTDLDYRPRSFLDGMSLEIAEMRSAGAVR